MQDDIVGVIDASGNIVASYSYDTWGALLSSSGSMANINPLRYRGYYYDSDTGMYYLQSRYYDPSLKRFINADIYTDTCTGVLGVNMYAYCGNSPIIWIDLTGYDAVILFDKDAAKFCGVKFGHAAIMFESYGMWFYFSSNGILKRRKSGNKYSSYDMRYLGQGLNLRSMTSIEAVYNNLWKNKSSPYYICFNDEEKYDGLDCVYKFDYFFYIEGDFNLYSYCVDNIMNTKYDKLTNNCWQTVCNILLQGTFTGKYNTYIRKMYEMMRYSSIPNDVYPALKCFYDNYKTYYSTNCLYTRLLHNPYRVFLNQSSLF